MTSSDKPSGLPVNPSSTIFLRKMVPLPLWEGVNRENIKK
jgi:hypothetical protein